MMKMLIIIVIDVGRISLFKQSKNKYFTRYEDFNKMNIVPLQLKIKNFYYEIHDDVYRDKGFSEKKLEKHGIRLLN